jgi:hypothetical protein
MKQLTLISFFGCFFLFAHSQWRGEILDSRSTEALTGASITLYSGGTISGLVANKEGKFTYCAGSYDSVKSHDRLSFKNNFPLPISGWGSKIQLELALQLGEVVVKNLPH